ncbi:NADPH-dependent F420 reductase [Streptomyces sp. URMC 129]|uniref:NADPH-dependent F420 reductase n=1 Tax=Streptomyces sp. URMC 129 TaxID=3423407 RepID=UPI003F1AEB3C
MRIGILGAGAMADALGTQWARAGHQVMVSGRDTDRAGALAARIGSGARAGTFAEAVAFGEDAVLLAIRHDGVSDVLAAAGAGEGALRGRTLIDCVNAVVWESFTLASSAPMAERIAAAAPGAHVVKAFNVCHADVWRMTPPVFDGAPLAVPLCGDDPGALDTVRALVTDLGCVPLPGGGLERAGLLEATAAFAIGLWLGHGADARAMLPPLTHP